MANSVNPEAVNWCAEASRKVAIVGECMVEICESRDGRIARHFAGDTLNTAVYFRREAIPESVQLDYLTAIGVDPFSDAMMADWQREGIGVDLVQRLPGEMPGLYWIQTDEHGERSFYYWRQHSAARKVLDSYSESHWFSVLKEYKFVYFTGISVAILDAPDRQKWLSLVTRLSSAGTTLIFDTNYRSALWTSREEARACLASFLAHIDVALVSYEDENHLFDDTSIQETISRLHSYGVREVVVKNGAHGCTVSSPALCEEVAAKPVLQAVDTTAAGDSFNAAYMAARMAGMSEVASAQRGHELASRVVQFTGAIVPNE